MWTVLPPEEIYVLQHLVGCTSHLLLNTSHLNSRLSQCCVQLALLISALNKWCEMLVTMEWLPHKQTDYRMPLGLCPLRHKMLHCLKQLDLSLHTISIIYVCPINAENKLETVIKYIITMQWKKHLSELLLSHSVKAVNATYSSLNTIKTQLLASHSNTCNTIKSTNMVIPWWCWWIGLSIYFIITLHT